MMTSEGETGVRRAGLAIAVLVLAGCQDRKAADEPEPQPTATPSEAASPVSILRPDVEQPVAVLDQLEPLSVTLGFPEGGEEFSASAIKRLEEALASPQMQTGGAVVLRSHTDAAGTDAVNQRVSMQRGEAVRDWLIENDIAEERISVIAFGEQNPVEPNALPDGTPNEAGRAANRRVEMTVAIGTKPPKMGAQPTPAQPEE